MGQLMQWPQHVCAVQLARLQIQLQQQGITLPDAPRVSSEVVHMGVPGMPDMPLRDQMHTSGDSHASLPTSHISPRSASPHVV